MADDHEAVTDEDDDSENGIQTPELQGVLLKWTNYIHGWQKRFIVLKDGTLSYYKSQEEQGFGCRGALSLCKAIIKPHEFDECRFDVSVNDCVWYLRADSPEDKQHWVDILEAFKAESGYSSECSLKRHGSTVSLTSVTLSSTSASSYKKCRGLKEKLAEMETYRDILCTQMDTLQKYFDSCAEFETTNKNINQNNDENFAKGKHAAVDFKGEAMTFKATSGAVLTGLAQCIEAISKREEMWRRKLEKEHQRLVRLEESCLALREKRTTKTGPDQEEGPHSTLGDEEFYDAVETGLERIEEEAALRELLRENSLSEPPITVDSAIHHLLWPETTDKLRVLISAERSDPSSVSQANSSEGKEALDNTFKVQSLIIRAIEPVEQSLCSKWELMTPSINVIERITKEQVHYASLGVGEGPWQLFAEEGDMKMYRREEELNGLVIDPLKACHIVKGVTGREMCHYFFSPQYRKDWETTLEQMTVLEKISENILVFLQVHKRIWPTAQRDALFWSHTTHMTDPNDHDGHDIWAVVNHSTQLPHYPLKTAKCLRVALTVCLYCQTLITPPKDGTQVSRDNITCKITYCSVVNPGGWVPASALRAVYKREYPKFLKRFTAYVMAQTKDKPIMF